MIVDSAHYKDGVRQHEEALTPERAGELRRSAGAGEFVWIGIHEPGSGDLEQLQNLFGLHELAVEDAQQAHQRPKIEDYGEEVFLVLKTAHYHEDQEEVHFGEIHGFAGPGYVITVRHGPGSELATARQRLEARPDLVKLGASSAIWAILDKVVDDYIPVVDAMEDDIEEVEKDVFDDDIPAPTRRIYHLKREVIEFHRAVWPLLNPLETLEQGGFERVPEELRSFFRDVADHARRVDEQVQSQRELLTSVLQANLSLVSVNQNEVVKKISAVFGIIALPTFIASVYGMNFDNMPELHWHYGNPRVIGVMALWLGVTVAFFRRIAWFYPEFDAAASRARRRRSGLRASPGRRAHPGGDRLLPADAHALARGPARPRLEDRLLRLRAGADRDRVHLAARTPGRPARPGAHGPAPADGRPGPAADRVRTDRAVAPASPSQPVARLAAPSRTPARRPAALGRRSVHLARPG